MRPKRTAKTQAPRMVRLMVGKCARCGTISAGHWYDPSTAEGRKDAARFAYDIVSSGRILDIINAEVITLRKCGCDKQSTEA